MFYILIVYYRPARTALRPACKVPLHYVPIQRTPSAKHRSSVATTAAATAACQQSRAPYDSGEQNYNKHTKPHAQNSIYFQHFLGIKKRHTEKYPIATRWWRSLAQICRSGRPRHLWRHEEIAAHTWSQPQKERCWYCVYFYLWYVSWLCKHSNWGDMGAAVKECLVVAGQQVEWLFRMYWFGGTIQCNNLGLHDDFAITIQISNNGSLII